MKLRKNLRFHTQFDESVQIRDTRSDFAKMWAIVRLQICLNGFRACGQLWLQCWFSQIGSRLGARTKDMPSILEDEGRGIGPIWLNPPFSSKFSGTRFILSLDSVANYLKWPTLLRNLRLASDKMKHASTITIIVHRP